MLFNENCRKFFAGLVGALFVAGLFGVFGAGAANAAGEKIVLSYAENQRHNYPTTQAARKFAELVAQRSDGRIKVKIYDNAKMGDEKAVVDKLIAGQVDMSRVNLPSLTEFCRELEILQLPYLYRDEEHMWKVLDGDIGNGMFDKLRDSGLVGLSWFDGGVRNFYTKVPVDSPDDLIGLTIRAQGAAIAMDMVEAMGAKPVAIVYSEVYDALKNGQIDGAENNLPSYESMKHYKWAKYYCLDEHTRMPEMQVFSQKTWDKLSPADRELIAECAKISAQCERELWKKREASAAKKVTAAGTIIVPLYPEERQKFIDAVMPFYEQYDGEDKKLIERIKNEA